MPNLIIGLENIWRFLFVAGDKKLISFRQFKRKYLPELYQSEIIQINPTISGSSASAYDNILIQWRREKFIHPKYL